MIPGTGLCPSARGAQGWADANNPNCVAPGKRPRITPNPVMLLQDGRPVFALGTPGGDLQPQAVLQALLNMLDFGMSPQQAVEAPRFVSWSFPNSREPHAYQAGLLSLESRIPRATGESLAGRGHRIGWWPARTGRAGGVCGIRFDHRTGIFEAAADFRRAGYALGW
jgi:gamma-glutamyltranspeptidase/glutathione hydrolase